MAELSDRELDALIADKVMGFGNAVKVLNGRYGATCEGYVAHFSTDRNAAAEVLERIAELNLIHEFANELERITNPGVVIWHGAIATPRQICEAALKACDVPNV